MHTGGAMHFFWISLEEAAVCGRYLKNSPSGFDDNYFNEILMHRTEKPALLGHRLPI